MERIGLIAGGGELPVIFVESVKRSGDKVIVFGLEKAASPGLKNIADKFHWINIGQPKKIAILLVMERIKKIAMVGKVDKKIIYQNKQHDEKFSEAIKDVRKEKDSRDYSLLQEATRQLNKLGIEVIDGMKYLSHLIVEKGPIGSVVPEDDIKEDIEYGTYIARKIADMDIGQTVIVKSKNIVAVEAMEGTDNTIKRAYEAAGEGCVMVKVGRPNQDMRWDVPTIGPDTIEKLARNKFKALAVEAGKMFVINRREISEIADSHNIAVMAI